jgi:hypothetical protein
MSLLRFEGFDEYGSNTGLIEGNFILDSYGANDFVESGRYGGWCYRFRNTSTIAGIRTYGIGFGVTTCTRVRFGFAFKHHGSLGDMKIATLNVNANIGGGLGLTNTGALCFFNPWGSITSSSSKTLTAGKWYYIEGILTVTNSTVAGDLVAYVNGEKVLENPVGSDYSNSATTAVGIDFGPQRLSNNINDVLIDDIYIVSTGGVDPTGYLGNVHVVNLAPTGNGPSGQFVGSDGDSTDNFELVDDSVASGTDDYVTSSGVGYSDVYGIQNLPDDVNVVHAIESKMLLKSAGAGVQMTHVVNPSGTAYESGTFDVSFDEYGYDGQLMVKNPVTDGEWTPNAVNELTAGFKIKN